MWAVPFPEPIDEGFHRGIPGAPGVGEGAGHADMEARPARPGFLHSGLCPGFSCRDSADTEAELQLQAPPHLSRPSHTRRPPHCSPSCSPPAGQPMETAGDFHVCHPRVQVSCGKASQCPQVRCRNKEAPAGSQLLPEQKETRKLKAVGLEWGLQRHATPPPPHPPIHGGDHRAPRVQRLPQGSDTSPSQ